MEDLLVLLFEYREYGDVVRFVVDEREEEYGDVVVLLWLLFLDVRGVVDLLLLLLDGTSREEWVDDDTTPDDRRLLLLSRSSSIWEESRRRRLSPPLRERLVVVVLLLLLLRWDDRRLRRPDAPSLWFSPLLLLLLCNDVLCPFTCASRSANESDGIVYNYMLHRRCPYTPLAILASLSAANFHRMWVLQMDKNDWFVLRDCWIRLKERWISLFCKPPKIDEGLFYNITLLPIFLLFG